MKLEKASDYGHLLKVWCEGLLALQIREQPHKELNGGILCPACLKIHGRSGDAIYPLLATAKMTGDSTYVKSAKELFQWTKANLQMPDGGFRNDATSQWEGITVFFVIQLVEALSNHQDLLDSETISSWQKTIKEATSYLEKRIFDLETNVNYLISSAAAFALVGQYFNDSNYLIVARKSAQLSLAYFTENHLIYGEGWPHDTLTPKKCRPIDLGYSVEESLSNLALYVSVTKDHEVEKVLLEALKEHQYFMLNDGGWDNSWGSRNYKWSYWGSRTADGCQLAYGTFLSNDASFGEVIYRNTKLLAELTENGLLAGGPMFSTAGAPSCVHHTFCHAKALAFLVDHQITPIPSAVIKLPMEKETQQFKHYPEAGIYLMSKGGWRSTISEYDFVYDPSGSATGGALTFLSERQMGPLIAASTNHYQLLEENNMQLPKRVADICQTPRIEIKKAGKIYRNIHDLTADIDTNSTDCSLVAKGKLRTTKDQEALGDFRQSVILTEEQVIFQVSAEESSAVFHLPIIASSQDQVIRINSQKVLIKRQKGMVMIHSSSPLKIQLVDQEKKLENQRIFNPVGGFETVPLVIQLHGFEQTIIVEKYDELLGEER